VDDLLFASVHEVWPGHFLQFLHSNVSKSRIGQIVQALKRDARYLSAIGLHTRVMTVVESEMFFLEGAFLDPGNAPTGSARHL
jgi:hypothetical protein